MRTPSWKTFEECSSHQQRPLSYIWPLILWSLQCIRIRQLRLSLLHSCITLKKQVVRVYPEIRDSIVSLVLIICRKITLPFFWQCPPIQMIFVVTLLTSGEAFCFTQNVSLIWLWLWEKSNFWKIFVLFCSIFVLFCLLLYKNRFSFFHSSSPYYLISPFFWHTLVLQFCGLNDVKTTWWKYMWWQQ